MPEEVERIPSHDGQVEQLHDDQLVDHHSDHHRHDEEAQLLHDEAQLRHGQHLAADDGGDSERGAPGREGGGGYE